jgi:hypothetical protein
MTCASTASTFTLSLNPFFSHSYQLLSRNSFLFTTICVAGVAPSPSPFHPVFFVDFQVFCFHQLTNPPARNPSLFSSFQNTREWPLSVLTFRLLDFQTFRLPYRRYPHTMRTSTHSLISAQLSELGVSALSFSGLSTFNLQLSTLFGRIE